MKTMVLLPAAALLALTAIGPGAAGDGTVSGSFEGRSRHVAEGTVSVERTADGVVVVLERDFKFDGAPDPKLGFGKGGYDPTTKFAPLGANAGEQRYDIPASIDTQGYDEVWIWCEKYAVPLGVAKLK